MAEHFEYVLNDPAICLSDLLEAVETHGRNLLWPDAARFRVSLILDELITNSCTHGNKNKNTLSYTIRLTDQEKKIVIELIDSGELFDPTKNPAEPCSLERPIKIGGIGLCLVRRLAASVTYSRNEERNCLRIVLDKYKEPSCSVTK